MEEGGGGGRERWVGWGEQVHLHAKFICGKLNMGANRVMAETCSQRCVKDAKD